MQVALGFIVAILILFLVLLVKSFKSIRNISAKSCSASDGLAKPRVQACTGSFLSSTVSFEWISGLLPTSSKIQETITRDGVAVRVNAVLWFRADSPVQVVTSVEDWRSATVQAAETALRDAIGQSDLDLMLKDRASINHRLQQLLRDASLKWGVEIDPVEIKDVDIPEQMQRAIAREAEAVREKRARIVRAEGEQEAAAKLASAAETIGMVPGALELRRLQTLAEIGVEHNSTIVAMLPVELIHAARRFAGGDGKDEPQSSNDS